MLADLVLEPELGRDVDLVVAAIEQAVRDALREVKPKAAVRALCLYPGQEDLFPAAVFVGLESDRRKAFATSTSEGVFATIWNPETFTGGDWPVDVGPHGDALEDAGARVARGLRDAGTSDPVRWVLCRVARDLGSEGWPWPVTDDFVVYLLDDQFGEDLTENLRFSASSHALEILTTKGLLAPFGPSDLTAVVTELMDDDLTMFTATFECDVRRGEELWESGPIGVSLEEALGWAREHCGKIRLSVASEEHTAGSEAIPGLPLWNDERPVEPRPVPSRS